jgi:hypothetical protein
MQRKNKFAQILKNKAGASLLMVLGIMAMLLIIGVSALVAASANAGAAINQRVNNQLNIYAESVIQTIMHSINEVVKDDGKRVESGAPVPNRPVTLGGQLIRAIYLHETTTPPNTPMPPLNLTITLPDGTIVPVMIEFKIVLDEQPFVPFTQPIINWTYIPGFTPEGDPIALFANYWDMWIEGEAAMDMIDAEITFRIDINHRGKEVSYLLEYQLSGVVLEGEYIRCTLVSGFPTVVSVPVPVPWYPYPNPPASCLSPSPPCKGCIDTGFRTIVDVGKWEVKEYEKISG